MYFYFVLESFGLNQEEQMKENPLFPSFTKHLHHKINFVPQLGEEDKASLPWRSWPMDICQLDKSTFYLVKVLGNIKNLKISNTGSHLVLIDALLALVLLSRRQQFMLRFRGPGRIYLELWRIYLEVCEDIFGTRQLQTAEAAHRQPCWAF